MKFEEFVEAAKRTESIITEAELNVQAFTDTLELFILVGTLLDYTKKGIFYKNYEKYDTNFIELTNKINDKFCMLLENNKIDRSIITSNDVNFRWVHGMLGVLTESSELAEHLLSYMENGHIDHVGVIEEFSDQDWYKGILKDSEGYDYDKGRQNVIDKLKVRFPEKFTIENAANRNLELERKELEK